MKSTPRPGILISYRDTMTQSKPCPHPRADLVDRYRRNRARSREVFALLADEAYYSQPIALRHPVIFYEGHLPGFSFNTLVRKALGGPSIDDVAPMLDRAGFDATGQWQQEGFALTLAEAR
jgi:hypothetical protein